jgi:hypothetical protein
VEDQALFCSGDALEPPVWFPNVDQFTCIAAITTSEGEQVEQSLLSALQQEGVDAARIAQDFGRFIAPVRRQLENSAVSLQAVFETWLCVCAMSAFSTVSDEAMALAATETLLPGMLHRFLSPGELDRLLALGPAFAEVVMDPPSWVSALRGFKLSAAFAGGPQ